MKIIHYKPINKGTIKASFTAVFEDGMKVLDCLLMNGDKGEWMTFPKKETVIKGVKEYIPYISFEDKAYSDNVKSLIMAELAKVDHETETKKRESMYGSGDKGQASGSQKTYVKQVVPGNGQAVWE